MPWKSLKTRPRKPRDPDAMFRATYADGQTASFTVSPDFLRNGDEAARLIATIRQMEGRLPKGEIVSVERVG